MTKSIGSDWYGTKQAAAALGITPRTLYRLIDDGQIPAYQLGRVLRVKVADVDAYLESVRVKPGSLKHLYPGGEEKEHPGIDGLPEKLKPKRSVPGER